MQVSGNWLGTQTLTAVTGGECVGDQTAAFVGSSGPLSFVISQSGSTLTTAIDSCSYSGKIVGATMTLELNPTGCSKVERNILCPNRMLRDTSFGGATLTATVVGNSASGTGTYRVNVFDAGTAALVGVLVEQFAFTLSR